MEILGLINIPSWLLTILLLFLTLYLYTAWKHSFWRRLGIPGPTPFPVIGGLKDMASKGVRECDYENIKKYGDVVGVYTGVLPTLLVTNPDMIKEIFIKDYHTFTNRVAIIKEDSMLSDMITAAKDDHWKFIRSTMTPTFTTGKLKHMIPLIQRCCDDLAKNITNKAKDGQVVEMKNVCGCFTMDVICSTAFGLSVNSQTETTNEFLHYAKKTVFTDFFKPYFIVILIFPFLKNIMGSLFKVPFLEEDSEKFFRHTISQLIEERKSAKNESFRDFIQLMLNAHKDKENGGELTELGAQDFSQYKSRGMTENEILVNSIVFFIAGYDTTANSLAFAVYELALNQDVQDRLIKEIDDVVGKKPATYECLKDMEYLDMFLSEVLRLYSAATRINRMTKHDTTVNGIFIPKGTDVTLPITALHRNPKYWPDPEKFDPERFTEENKAKRPLYTYLPFGLGPRVCIGMRLALTEAKLAIISILQNFKLQPCEKTEIPIPLEKGFLTRPLHDLYLKVEKR